MRDRGLLSNLGHTNLLRVHRVHAPWKPARLAIQASDVPHTALSCDRERAPVTVNALHICALVPFLAGRLTRNDAQPLQFLLAELEAVVVRALVLFARVVVAAAHADVVLIACFELFQAIDLVTVVVEDLVKALSSAIAANLRRAHGSRASEVGHGLCSALRG